MKKNLLLLTGIVFVITILVSGGCKQGTKDNAEATAGNEPKALAADSTKVDVFLKATLLDGKVHLLMSDSKKPGCEVIDGLITVVYPGYTVKWNKATDSNIDKVLDIRLIKADSIFMISSDGIGVMRSFKIEIPIGAKPDTIKYEIEFTVTWDTDTTCIDPYLRIED